MNDQPLDQRVLTRARLRRAWRVRSAISALAIAAAVLTWLLSMRLLFSCDPHALGEELIRGQMSGMQSGGIERERAAMRSVNPEWDFMGRTFAGLAFANRALTPDIERGEAERSLQLLNALIDATLRREAAQVRNT